MKEQNHLNDLAVSDLERIEWLRDEHDLDLEARWLASDEFEITLTTLGGALYFYSADELERWLATHSEVAA